MYYMKHISRSRSILKGKAGAELPQPSVFKIGVSPRTQTTPVIRWSF